LGSGSERVLVYERRRVGPSVAGCSSVSEKEVDCEYEAIGDEKFVDGEKVLGVSVRGDPEKYSAFEADEIGDIYGLIVGGGSVDDNDRK
jgi:hypothetical protein